MKIKISSLALLLFGFVMTCSAQRLYSEQNLKQASTSDLNLYLEKAKKLKKTGGVLLIAAPVSAATGIILSKHAWSGGTEDEWVLGAGLVLASAGATLAGIPIFFTGSSRVKRISKVWNEKYNAVLIDIAPCTLYDFHHQYITPGISLRIKF